MKPDGGPAFPFEDITAIARNGAREEWKNYTGMSLRDYFESEQTAAWIVALSRRYTADNDIMVEAVSLGKLTAEVMLAERGK